MLEVLARLMDGVIHEASTVFVRRSSTKWVGKWGGVDERMKGRNRGLMLVKYCKPDIVHQALPDSSNLSLSY